MKKILLSLIIASAGFAVKAQESGVKFGVKAGVTMPKFSISEDRGNVYKTNPSFYVGGTVELPLKDMFIVQSGLILSNKGSKLSLTGSQRRVGLMYIELPLNALVNFSVGEGKVFVGGGPYYGMGIGGKIKGVVQDGGISEDVKFGDDGDYRRGDFGINFLAGYQLGNGLNIHVGYGLGLSNIAPKTKNSVFSAGLGFSF